MQTLGRMNNELTLQLFFVLFFIGMFWLGLVAYMFHLLQQRYPAMYQSLGSLRGFEAWTTQAVFVFLLSRRPESL